MSVTVADVRLELQSPTQVLADADIASILVKVGNTDLNLVCAECLRFILRKYRGRVRYRIGKYNETVDHRELRKQIQLYMSRSSATDIEPTVADNTDDPNFFKRDGL